MACPQEVQGDQPGHSVLLVPLDLEDRQGDHLADLLEGRSVDSGGRPEDHR
jgi:hypothetical protein